MSSYGQGDPSIPALAMRAHDEAVRLGRCEYVDPATGFLVMTAERLRRLGECCGSSCRHCPFSAAEQRRAGRRCVRPG